MEFVKDCPPEKIYNPETKRCVLKTGAIGKKILQLMILQRKEPKTKEQKEPKTKKQKETKTKEQKEPKTKKQKEPKTKEPKEPKTKEPKEPKTKEPKEPKTNLKFIIIDYLTKIKNYLLLKKQNTAAKQYANVLTELYPYKKPIYTFKDFEKNIKCDDEYIKIKIKELIQKTKKDKDDDKQEKKEKQEHHKKNFKYEIIQHLTEIKNYLSQNNEYYKVKAYANVLSQLYGYKYPIYTYENFKTYIKAGDKINAKVKELIETGTIRYEEANIKKDKIYYFKDELKDVYGIGPAKANELVSYGITTMEQLKANQHLLNDKQKLGLLYYKDFKKRIPLKEYLKHKKIIEQYLKKDFKIEELIYEFVGSFRRGSDTMGDIDILMMENKNFDLKKLIMKLHKSRYIIEILALGNNKFMGICKIGDNPARRIDILIAPKEEYYYSLLYFTGSAEFNVGFRNYVKNEFKLSLSEHGLKGLKTAAAPIIKSEKDIFKYFKVPYLKPEERKIFINPRK